MIGVCWCMLFADIELMRYHIRAGVLQCVLLCLFLVLVVYMVVINCCNKQLFN